MQLRIEKEDDHYRVHFSFDDIHWFKLDQNKTFEETETQLFWLKHTLEQRYGQAIYD